MKEDLRVESTAGETVFAPGGGGMPGRITVKEFHRETVLSGGPTLTLTLRDRGVVRPDARTCEPLRYIMNGAEVVEFTDLGWMDETGNAVPDLHLALRWEFFPDGTVFCTAVFHGETSHPPVCRDLKLTFPLDFSAFDDCRFAVFPRCASQGAVDIQRIAPRRFVPAGTALEFPENLPLEYGFNLFRNSGPSLYAELFLESGAVLDGDDRRGWGGIRWRNGSPVVEWNFQTADTTKDHRPLQWRNRWGWRFAPPATRRKLPPQHCYQFIDNYRHYPDAAELETIARSGCSMLILHSNWRRDAANGAVPYDRAKLRMAAECAKRHGISLLLYIRGNEAEIVENAGAWFPRLLDPDKDGLYMDYAGPMGRQSPPDEFSCGGTVHFYQHYLTLKRLRENLGENGLLIGHTGAWFSNAGIAFCDAYISGEGERGQLLAGRREYEYFTMAAAAHGSLWSAAFPEYATTAIIPFIASTGQFPHSPLGMQFASSSLLHPPEPGINDTVFRPLWRIWGLFGRERDVAVFGDCNCAGIFGGAEHVGHYLMISADGRRALLVLADFGGRGEVTVNWSKTGFDPAGKRCFRLAPGESSPGRAREAETLTADFAAYPAEAYYFAPDDSGIAEFEADYPECGGSGRAFLAEIERQKQWRHPAPTRRAELRLYLDDHLCTALEDSMVADLFDEEVKIGVVTETGFRALGIVTPEGLTPPDADGGPRIQSGATTPPVDLAALLGPGKHHVAVKSYYHGEPFYSFITVRLTTDAGECALEFRN
ncbi:MAG: hypothetical protein MR051_08310, partial [Lentisphaeria bacterium]|nr:hypothetical protein [Lentisphaeria bacterium]